MMGKIRAYECASDNGDVTWRWETAESQGRSESCWSQFLGCMKERAFTSREMGLCWKHRHFPRVNRKEGSMYLC